MCRLPARGTARQGGGRTAHDRSSASLSLPIQHANDELGLPVDIDNVEPVAAEHQCRHCPRTKAALRPVLRYPVVRQKALPDGPADMPLVTGLIGTAVIALNWLLVMLSGVRRNSVRPQ
jgi:hypothetical protein